MTTVLLLRARCATLLLSITTLLSACGGGGGGWGQFRASGEARQPVDQLRPGASAVVRATASSGLPVRYVSCTPLVCNVNADSGQVEGLAEGSFTIDATQDGNAQLQAALTASLTLTVLHDRRQAITFAALPTLPYLGSATVQASTSSGLTVVLASSPPASVPLQPSVG